MNIFVVDSNPIIAARQLCDQHVVKMITESVQMLSNAMWHAGLEGPYKKTHWNHPCSKWVRESISNYQWLWNHADELGKEFNRRYSKDHLAHKKLRENVPNNILLPNIGLTNFANCTPYKNMEIVEAYRNFYNNDKSKFARWKNNNAPIWFRNY